MSCKQEECLFMKSVLNLYYWLKNIIRIIQTLGVYVDQSFERINKSKESMIEFLKRIKKIRI